MREFLERLLTAIRTPQADRAAARPLEVISIEREEEERTAVEIIADLNAIRDLEGSAGWRILTDALREADADYDRLLHTERVDDLIRMQTCQTATKVIRDFLQTPHLLMAAYHAELAQREPHPDEKE